MITCLGLIVRCAENIDDVLRLCTKHVKQHHLHSNVSFEVNGTRYMTLYDTYTAEDGSFWCLFDTLDGTKRYVLERFA